MKQLKIIFTCFTSLLIAYSSYSQNPDTLVQKAMEYFENEQYEKAAMEFEKALPTVEEEYGALDTSYYSKQVYYTAQCFQEINQYDKAEQYYLVLKYIFEENKDTISWDYAELLNSIGNLYVIIGQYEKAERLIKQAIDIDNIQKEKNDTLYVNHLNNLAQVYYMMEKYSLTESVMKQVIEINKLLYGENHIEYAGSLSNLGVLYYTLGQFEKAEPLLQQALEIDKSQLGEFNENYGRDLNNLFTLYFVKGLYKEAEPLIIKAIEIYKELLGENNPDYYVLLNNLATLYQKMGYYEKAVTIMIKIIKYDSTLNVENVPYYGRHLNNLALLYQNLGLYEKAEPLYIKSLEAEKQQFGETSTLYSTVLYNIAYLYKDMGRYELAESLIKQSIEIEKNRIGNHQAGYALLLNGLGIIYRQIGNYEDAEIFMKQALEIEKKELGISSTKYGIHLGNFAGLHTEMGNYIRADSIYIQCLGILKNTVTDSSLAYATYLSSYANLLFLVQRFEEAESTCFEALEIYKNLVGSTHLQYAKVLNILSRIYWLNDRNELSEKINIEVLNIFKYQIKHNTGYLSDKELGNFLNIFFYNLDIYQSLNLKQNKISNSAGKQAFEIELVRKGIKLKSTMNFKARVLDSGDTSLINAYNDLISIHRQIYKLSSSITKKENIEKVKLLESQANALEKTLSLKSKEYQQAKKENEITWEDVKQNLKPSEAAIEFSSFNYYNGKEATDSILYCAVVLRKGDYISQMVYLCEESALIKAISSSDATSRKINFLYQEQTLNELIWQPIDSLLEGIHTIYFAPSGLLHSVSMAAILCSGNKVLMDKYNLVQLSSTRTLAIPADPVIINDAVVYGGINYDTDSLTLSNNAEKYTEDKDDFIAYNRSYTGEFRGGFRYLPGSQEEMESIAAKLEKKDIPFTSLSGTEAIEESFLALSGKNAPSVIHLSTHGFYFPDTVSEENRKNISYSSTGEVRFRYNDDPLLRSGLLMAGANLAWKGQAIPDNVEDGILTAKEVSNMNLMNTELVVLSACQSGLGDVKGSEGVEGLQRGFKMAGVRYIIMSLWQVPDKETTEFMDKFYDHWLGGKDIHEAFHHTQKHMRHKYKNDPFKWAGFVLME
jgi:tetratricopeptide (TPR) repeat protein